MMVQAQIVSPNADPMTGGNHYVDNTPPAHSNTEMYGLGGVLEYKVFNNAGVMPPDPTGDIIPNSLHISIGFPTYYGPPAGFNQAALDLANPSGAWTLTWVQYDHTVSGGMIEVTNAINITAGAQESIYIPVVPYILSSVSQWSTITIDRETPLKIANVNPNNDVLAIGVKVMGLPNPAPLSLLNFTVQEQSCGVVELKWQTAMEKNLDKFVVEYSKDGKSFAAVKEVKAKNEANGASYSTTVKQEGKEGFYRLNSIDFDKTNAYSHVSKIVLSCSTDKLITVAPNPATNTLTVATLEGSETIQIMNAIGQKVLEVKAKKGENVVDISQLPAANYNLLIVEEGKTTATFKVVKL